eukprot:CAMPEP_0172680988 /NCGR_PEP_ID=MMETSP1074-20121228/17141_1 /TAXON_ID=2916 /ORGANISM="Ceratium fusus, Strain PA161109" /LENGTH=55 /DNA_ID=CAMNT_0013499411 /DNA_START=146 /DNA_END=313 /DNA_ORIENTATION=-
MWDTSSSRTGCHVRPGPTLSVEMLALPKVCRQRHRSTAPWATIATTWPGYAAAAS